jgi:enoyl-CoA hydratase
MVSEILDAMEGFEADSSVRAIVLSGKGRAFAAGADIDEMANDNAIDFELRNQFKDWDRLAMIKKPIIGAVQGFAFGGGFELALCCDLLYAADDAEFGFPEVNLGVMPGAGGTQRLTKLAGKTKAMEWLFTGKRISAREALHHGIVNQLISKELLMEETMKAAEQIANQAPISIRLIKEAILKAVDSPLKEGMEFERKNFYLLFSTDDQKEGMQAFIEKRKPHFKGK